MNGLLSWLWSRRRVSQFSTEDGSRGARRRRELICLEHKPSSGEQVSAISVRWTCECGAFRFEIDAPAPLVREVPTAAYLEMERRGLRGQKGPWRSQITGKPLPVNWTASAGETAESGATAPCERMYARRAEEYVERFGPYAARDEGDRADHRHDLWLAEALFRAAERADGGHTSWPF
ncbi:hypothetical protein [Saccharopolyspora dendranthemae]|uniref:Uncharacterized protein n=1 Tax=Saccharopolyspora dendranthemae TaxID=1181886 RepID=A0A561U515_9PSEU|nr:hypothetical protein [Saccharopolyspora dendranthemae]TWF94423.1 hypothetical protein FHU35_13130 [Saccharopolyspora dendranthemae]